VSEGPAGPPIILAEQKVFIKWFSDFHGGKIFVNGNIPVAYFAHDIVNNKK
jgi:hypothetical protein